MKRGTSNEHLWKFWRQQSKWFLRCLLMSSWHRTRGHGGREGGMERERYGDGYGRGRNDSALLWHHRGSYIPGGMEPAIPHFWESQEKTLRTGWIRNQEDSIVTSAGRTAIFFLCLCNALTTYLSYSSIGFHTILWPLTLWTWAQLECVETVGLLRKCRCSWPPLSSFFYCVMDCVQVGALLSIYTDWFYFSKKIIF